MEHENASGAQPLAGVRVVNTRPADQAASLTRLLAERGAEVIELPMIRIAPPQDTGPLRRAVARIDEYDWLVLTSANAVDALRQALADEGLGAEALAVVRVAVVGSATAQRLSEWGVRASVVPDQFVADALVPALKAAADLERQRFLLPQGDLARPDLTEALRDEGAAVDPIVAYRTVRDESSADRLGELFDTEGADCVAFTSPSTVYQFVEAAGVARLREMGGRIALVSIGPVTTRALRERGLTVAAEADPHDVSGLVRAIESIFHR